MGMLNIWEHVLEALNKQAVLRRQKEGKEMRVANKPCHDQLCGERARWQLERGSVCGMRV